MWFQMISLPLVGALIGWITNVLAIKLIFRPYKPVIIPVLNYRVQGLIPKRHGELAANVGQVMGSEVLSIDDVMLKLNENEIKDKLILSVVQTVSQRLDDRIPSLIPSSVKKIFLSLMGDILYKEVPDMIDSLIRDWSGKMKDEIDFSQMIEEKINGYDLAELERVILLIASRELKHIEILGAVLGFVIGTVEAVLLYLFV